MIYSNKENIKSIKDLLFNKKTIYFDDLKSSINHDKITLKT
jgi:hypothetical protein